MFKKITFCLFLMNAITSACSTGCLRCKETSSTNTTTICVLCDTYSGYYLGTTNQCVMSTLTQCALLGHSGTCLVCNSNYYMNNGSCVAVETQNLIANCNYYSGATTCGYCKANYYIDGTNCVAVSSQALIAYCDIQSSATVCLSCAEGYIVRKNGSLCEKLPTTSSCLAYSDLECKECDPGYIKNQNLYELSLFTFDSNEKRNDLSEYLFVLKKGYNVYQTVNVCQQITVTNCQEAKTFNTCSICVDGYYLTTDLLCQVDPLPRIQYCTTYEYSSSNYGFTCIECEQGYYAYQNECVKVTDVENCLTYKKDLQTSTQCATCKETHYLQSTNSCTARTNYTIANCSTYETSLNKCKTCNTDYFLSSDGIQCYQKLKNCQSHQSIASGNSNADVVCTDCSDGYYLQNSTTCTKGTIVNCEVYEQIANQTCSVCKDQYYTVSGGTKCAAQHPTINRCLDYDPSTDNICLECQAEYSPVVYDSICKTVVTTTVSHCTDYNLTAPYNCQECEDEYYLNSIQNVCTSIGNNCKTFNTNTDKCTDCKDNFQIFQGVTDNTCEIIPEYITSKCDQYQDGTNTFFSLTSALECEVCASDASPLSEKNLFACVENEYLDLISFSHATSNCIKYDSNGCLQCQEGYFIDNSNTCIQACEKELYPVSIYINDPTDFEINVCTNVASNYLIKGYDVNPNNVRDQSVYNFSCNDTLPTSDFDTWDLEYTNINISNINSSNQISGNWIDHPADVWPKITCGNSVSYYIDSNSQIYTFQTPTYNQMLKIYKINDTAGVAPYIYQTVKCNWGQTGGINSFIIPAITYYYVNCDNTNDFDSDYYYNIPVYWSQFFSVHKCNSANDIPVLAYEGISTTNLKFANFKPWTSRSVGNNWDDTSNYMDNIICMNLNNTDDLVSVLNFTSGSLTSTFTAMTNCGLAVLNLKVLPDDFDNTEYTQNNQGSRNNDQSLYCAACKPGYHENSNVTNPEQTFLNSVFRNCVAISNCNLNGNNNMFNGCGECNTGYTWKYDTEIIFDECVAVPSYLTNCMAYDNTNDKCALCDKGYYLNLDHVCVQITIDNCDSFVNYYTEGSYQGRQYLQQSGQGCLQCSGQYTSVAIKKSNNDGVQLCYSSNYLEGSAINATLGVNQNDREKGEYVVHCAKYNTSTLKCDQCDDGYVPNDGLTNNPSLCTAMSNCDLTNADGSACNECSLGYAMVNSNCVLGTLLNCQQYNETTKTNSNAQCAICDDGYYLTSQKTCSLGYIPHCKTFRDTQPNQCSECENGYSLVIATGNYGHLCIKQLNEMKCADVTLVKNSSIFQATCNSCDSITDDIVNVILDENSSTGIYGQCYPINNITGCEEYDNSVVDHSSAFQLACTKCTNKTYYLNPNNSYECIARTKTDVNCASYLTEEDGCEVCNTSYFLNEGNLVEDLCIPYPTGDYHCIDYEIINSKLTCTLCEDLFYLSGGVCNEVTTPVTKCAHYSSASDCDECETGYFLTNSTTCTQITISNCKVYESATSCSECLNKYKKTTTSSVSTCVQYDNMNSCEIEQSGECVLCNTGYYPKNGICTSANTITGCVYYDTQTTCQQCSSSYSLSADQTQCISENGIDQNCYITETQNTPVCSICTAGYQFSGSSCSQNTVNATNGCFAVDSDKKCIFCIPGWSMLSAGSCTNNNPEQKFIQVMVISISFLFTLFIQ